MRQNSGIVAGCAGGPVDLCVILAFAGSVLENSRTTDICQVLQNQVGKSQDN